MLKIGLIGASGTAEEHIKLLKSIANFDLVGIYDDDRSRLLSVAESFKIKPFFSIDDLLEQVEAVDIIKSVAFNYAHVSKAIKLTKHLFIEAPLTISVEEAKQLLELAEEANVIAQVYHIGTSKSVLKAALPYINNPMFVESHRTVELVENTDISFLLDLMTNDLNIILNIVNANIKNINTTGVDVISMTPDVINTIIKFDNGCVANLTLNRISSKNQHITKFFQKETCIEIDYLKRKTSLFGLKINGEKEIYAKKGELIDDDTLEEELKAFFYAVAHSTSPKVGIDDALKTIEVISQIKEMLKNNSLLIEN